MLPPSHPIGFRIMATSTTSFYSVCFEAQPPLLRGVVQRPMSIPEFIEACEMLYRAAQQHRCPFWLLDGRADSPEIRPLDVYTWLTDEFLPQVRQSLGRLPCLAFIAQPGFWQALQARHYAMPRPMQLSPAFWVNWFTTEDEALDWLHQFRTWPEDNG
jgi:hypothetical protein